MNVFIHLQYNDSYERKLHWQSFGNYMSNSVLNPFKTRHTQPLNLLRTLAITCVTLELTAYSLVGNKIEELIQPYNILTSER